MKKSWYVIACYDNYYEVYKSFVAKTNKQGARRLCDELDKKYPKDWGYSYFKTQGRLC